MSKHIYIYIYTHTLATLLLRGRRSRPRKRRVRIPRKYPGVFTPRYLDRLVFSHSRKRRVRIMRVGANTQERQRQRLHQRRPQPAASGGEDPLCSEVPYKGKSLIRGSPLQRKMYSKWRSIPRGKSLRGGPGRARHQRWPQPAASGGGPGRPTTTIYIYIYICIHTTNKKKYIYIYK